MFPHTELTTELQEPWPEPLAPPALQGSLADVPAGGQLLLIEVSDVHFGLLPNGLAGVHEGAVRPASQGDRGLVRTASQLNGVATEPASAPPSELPAVGGQLTGK